MCVCLWRVYACVCYSVFMHKGQHACVCEGERQKERRAGASTRAHTHTHTKYTHTQQIYAYILAPLCISVCALIAVEYKSPLFIAAPTYLPECSCICLCMRVICFLTFPIVSILSGAPCIYAHVFRAYPQICYRWYIAMIQTFQ